MLGFTALVAYGWWATSLRPFSVAATAAVVGAGAVAIAWGMSQRNPPSRSYERADVGRWLVLAAILGVWQMAAYVQEPRSGHPTLSSMANVVLEPHFVRALTCALWLILAMRLAAR
jgi:hypothetical protein